MWGRLIAVVALGGISAGSGALAHEGGDDPAASWFRSLAKPGMGSCCDIHDCRRTDDWGIDAISGRYWVRIGGERVMVNEENVVRGVSNPTGMAVECHATTGEIETPWVRCFVPPVGV